MRLLPLFMAVGAASVASASIMPESSQTEIAKRGSKPDISFPAGGSVKGRRAHSSLSDLFGLSSSRRRGTSARQHRRNLDQAAVSEGKLEVARAAPSPAGPADASRRRRHAANDAAQPIKRAANDPHPYRRAATCSAKKTTTTSSSKTSTSTSTSKSSTTTKAATSTSSTKASSTSTSKTSTSTTTTAVKSTSTMIMGGYYPSWVSGTLPPSSIDWTLFDVMAFAFAVPTATGGVTLDSYVVSTLQSLVTGAHAAGKKVILSIGGWGQSDGFSQSVATDALRQTFATSMKTIVDKYSLDGVDLDWEYPNSAYAGTYSGADAANYQTFLGVLRTTLGTSKIISAATAQAPWISSTGGTVGSVARAAAAIDYIMLMNYDVWGSSSTPGPNAPLANLCGNSTQPGASAAAAVKAWTAAGMPASKLLLGNPYYGYISTSTKTKLIQRDLDGNIDQQALLSRRGGPPPSRSQIDMEMQKRDVSASTGSINFDALITAGVLTLSGSTYVAGGGYTKYWDDCSDTPYLANGKKVITYDDPDSIFDKAAFAKEAGLAGCSTWSVDGDTSDWVLTKATRKGMGLS